ncbi:hypothetical protein M8J75_000124 [Diaphorina citri]|nr:hypothetical protein M8J75_000124 [Diaphorina citri]
MNQQTAKFSSTDSAQCEFEIKIEYHGPPCPADSKNERECPEKTTDCSTNCGNECKEEEKNNTPCICEDQISCTSHQSAKYRGSECQKERICECCKHQISDSQNRKTMSCLDSQRPDSLSCSVRTTQPSQALASTPVKLEFHCKLRFPQDSQEKQEENLDLSPIKESKVPIIWLLGKPGTGKETQAQNILSKFPEAIHISTGDLLRAEVRSGNTRGRNIEAIMKQGGLVPDDIVREVLYKKMLQELAKAKLFLIDGYPRDKDQADQFVKDTKEPAIILYLDAPDDVILARLVKRGLTSGRPDDKEDAIKKRLIKARENDGPILQAFKSHIAKVNFLHERRESVKSPNRRFAGPNR